MVVPAARRTEAMVAAFILIVGLVGLGKIEDGKLVWSDYCVDDGYVRSGEWSLYLFNLVQCSSRIPR